MVFITYVYYDVRFREREFSLKMIKIDRNMSQFWWIVCVKKYNFNISAFVDLIVWIRKI